MLPMSKRAKVLDIAKMLNGYYPDPPIPLNHQDTYTLLVSVLLSAQCTDERVNKITPYLFDKADNPLTMTTLSVEQIRDIIRPCGLSPQKSKAIHKLSEIIVDEYQGKVPRTLEELETLPGVGHKTAQVVMAQAYGVPSFPVDTHIHRLAFRWGLSNGKNVMQTEKDLKRLFPEEIWNKLHLQIIYFGREYCPARGHDFGTCPICSKYGRKSLYKGATS